MPRKTFPVKKLLREIELGHFSHLKNPYFNGLEHLSLKVPNVKFEFDVSAHALTSNAVMSKI